MAVLYPRAVYPRTLSIGRNRAAGWSVPLGVVVRARSGCCPSPRYNLMFGGTRVELEPSF